MELGQGTIHNGQIALPHPLNLPEGTVVTISTPHTDPESPAAADELLGSSPEAIARWRAGFSQLESLQMSNAEEAAWKNDRELQKEFEKSRFLEEAEKFNTLFP